MTSKQCISFTKMHGLGNDFVVINNHLLKLPLEKINISELADRHRGIGFDQLLLIEPSSHADFYCRIFNADATEAEQCGNGLRCIARYIIEENLHTSKTFTIATKAGIFPVYVKNFEHISVTLGNAIDNHKLHTFINNHNEPLVIHALSLGNPHAIVRVDHIDNAPMDLATTIADQSYFPDGANVGFMEIINHAHIRLRTYERGVGETNACGSNACAAALIGILHYGLDKKVFVNVQHGTLTIEQTDNGIVLTGPSARVFDGTIYE